MLRGVEMITTKRLKIRPLQMRDDRAWFAAHCAMLPTRTPWEIQRVPIGKLTFPNYLKILKQHQAERAEGKRHTLGIFHKEVGCLLGFIYIDEIDHAMKTGSLDFRLFNIYWGKGYAKEAVGAGLKVNQKVKLKKITLNKMAAKKLKL